MTPIRDVKFVRRREGSTSCLLCGSDEIANLGPRSRHGPVHAYQEFLDVPVETFDRSIVRCAVCGLQSIDPMYTDDDLGLLYAQEGYRRFMEIIHPEMTRFLLRAWRAEFVALGASELVAATAPRRPRFLDIGCGLGRNMIVFQRLGFDVVGLDMNEDETSYVRKALGFTAYNEDLANFAKRGETFDCVLASHFIEHVQDPHGFFDTVLPMVAGDGMLLVETPLVSDFSGSHAERYKDIYHTLFFDHFTLGLAGAMHGAEPRVIRNVVYFAGDGSFNMNMQIRYQRGGPEWSGLSDTLARNEYTSIRLGRQSYDALLQDSLLWARSHQNALRSARLAWMISVTERNLRRASHAGTRLQQRIRQALRRTGS